MFTPNFLNFTDAYLLCINTALLITRASKKKIKHLPLSVLTLGLDSGEQQELIGIA